MTRVKPYEFVRITISALTVTAAALGAGCSASSPESSTPVVQEAAPGGTPDGTAVDEIARPSSPAVSRRWTAKDIESEMPGAKGVSFELDGTLLPPQGPNSRPPELIVRCQDNRTDVILVAGVNAAEERGPRQGTSVSVRLDEAPARRERWRESSDREALYAPVPIRLAREIARAGTLQLEFATLDGPPVRVSFDVSGFDQHITRLASDCGWTP